MNFAVQFLKTMGQVILAGTPERAFKKARDSRMDSRHFQLWIALSSLSFALSFLIYLSVYWSGSLLLVFSPILNVENPPGWMFVLAENSWRGLGLGLLIGILLRAILRFSGFHFFLIAGLLLSGVLSLGAAWGVFLGGFLMGSLENFWCFPGKEFRLRSTIALVLGLAGLILAPLVPSLISLVFGGTYSVQLRWFQGFLMIFLFLLFETLVSLVFFHFYYARTHRLTKV